MNNMRSNRSLNRTLRDSLGKGLTKEEVKILARANARASGESVNVDIMTEANLLQWATGPDKIFVDSQILDYGWKYR